MHSVISLWLNNLQCYALYASSVYSALLLCEYLSKVRNDSYSGVTGSITFPDGKRMPTVHSDVCKGYCLLVISNVIIT